MVSCTYPEGEKHVFYFYENQFVDAVHRPDYKGNFACGPKRENTEKEFQPLQFVCLLLLFVDAQVLSCVWFFVTPETALCQTSCLSPSHRACSNSCPLTQWCHPTISSSVAPFSSCPQSFPISEVFPMCQLFASKYWSSSFSISPSNEYSGLISFKIDRFDLIAVQGTLKSLPQHHSSKASILRCSVFLIVQLSHSYITTGKTRALTRQNSVGKVKSMLFNMLFMLVITFLPRSKQFHGCSYHLQWFWSPRK